MKLLSAAFLWLALTSSLFASLPSKPLHELILPGLSFTNASVAEVASRISEAYKSEYERRNLREHPSEVHFQIHPSCSNVVVNIDLGRAHVYDAIQRLCRYFDLEYEDNYEGYFLLARKQTLPLSHRMYDVIPSAFSASDLNENDAAPFFTKLGVDFPAGASATYLPRVGKIIVRNTLANLGVFEKCLSVINIIPYQVETTVQLLQVSDFELANLTRQQTTFTNRMSLISASRELACLSTITESGGNATNSIGLQAVTSNNSIGPHGYAEIITRPVVSPIGDAIHVTLRISLELPFNENQLFSYETDTSLFMYHGASMLIWITPPASADAEEQLLCVVVTARLIGPDGKGHPVVDEATREGWGSIIY